MSWNSANSMELWNGQSAIEPATGVMVQAAQWLIDRGKGLWHVEELTKEYIISTGGSDACWCFSLDGVPAAAMLLTWHDPDFWPAVPPATSGFVHKLCVANHVHGMGLASLMLSAAETICLRRRIYDLRLDCAGDRPSLCRLYQRHGFLQVDRRPIGSFDTAFFHRHLRSFLE
jgi:GNAT superfamily N-acetyltransferase